MKLAPCLVAAIAAQSGDDADRWDNTDFTLTDNIFTYEAPKDVERYDGDACSGNELVIQAVTCWESNNMGNLDHYVTQNDDGFGWNNIHHGHDQGGHFSAKTGTGAGTQESNNYGKNVPSTSPRYQIGTYARGMMNDNGTALNRIDYHSPWRLTTDILGVFMKQLIGTIQRRPTIKCFECRTVMTPVRCLHPIIF